MYWLGGGADSGHLFEQAHALHVLFIYSPSYWWSSLYRRLKNEIVNDQVYQKRT